MNGPTLFERIANREIPAEIVFEDEQCLAFRDINPQAPVHVLIVPKKPIPSLDDVSSHDHALLAHLWLTIRQVAAQQHLTEGYRVVINCGRQGGQDVPHLHLHLLGGRDLQWPPG